MASDEYVIHFRTEAGIVRSITVSAEEAVRWAAAANDSSPGEYVDCSSKELAAWERAAEMAGQEFDDWFRETADIKAEQEGMN